MSNKITIDEQEYDFDTLSDAVKAQLMHLRIIDTETSRLQAQIAIHQTARIAYANALKAELAKLSEESEKA